MKVLSDMRALLALILLWPALALAATEPSPALLTNGALPLAASPTDSTEPSPVAPLLLRPGRLVNTLHNSAPFTHALDQEAAFRSPAEPLPMARALSIIRAGASTHGGGGSNNWLTLFSGLILLLIIMGDIDLRRPSAGRTRHNF